MHGVTPPPVFEYVRNTRSEAWIFIIECLIVGGGVVVFTWMMGSSLFYVLLLVVAVLAVAFVFVAFPNIRLNQQCTLRILPERIICESPHPRFGPSFDIELDAIQCIEGVACDGGGDWYIVTTCGERFEITEWYRVPRMKIISILRALRPELEVREVSVSGKVIRNV